MPDPAATDWRKALWLVVASIQEQPEADARVRELSELIRELGQELERVTWERDDALLQVLQADGRSHRALARELGLARQRVDQLAAIVDAGGRRADRA